VNGNNEKNFIYYLRNFEIIDKLVVKPKFAKALQRKEY
jgi:hypothetical protein